MDRVLAELRFIMGDAVFPCDEELDETNARTAVLSHVLHNFTANDGNWAWWPARPGFIAPYPPWPALDAEGYRRARRLRQREAASYAELAVIFHWVFPKDVIRLLCYAALVAWDAVSGEAPGASE